MLLIETSNDTAYWNCDINPMYGVSRLPFFNTKDVILITAWDEELNIIRKDFINIPMIHTSKTVEWYGDMAKFIYGNLCNKYGVKAQ